MSGAEVGVLGSLSEPTTSAVCWVETVSEWARGCGWTAWCCRFHDQPRVDAVGLAAEVFHLRHHRWPTRAELLALDGRGLADGFGGALFTGEVAGGFFVVSLGRDAALGARCGRWDEEDAVWWSGDGTLLVGRP